MSIVQRTLKNPFYYGLFRYNGELHQGSHEPMITKKLFEACQSIMHDRSRPKKRNNQKEYIFRGLFTCGECGCAITAETQKGHNYYRCTKKKAVCSQPYIREEALSEQISNVLQKVSLDPSLADTIIAELNKEKDQSAQDGAAFTQNFKNQIGVYENKLEKLLDAKLDSSISKDEYVIKKQKLLNEKVALTEKLGDFERKGNHWLERAKEFISEAKTVGIIALQENLSLKKDFLKKIGSNHLLRDRALFVSIKNPWKILFTRKAAPYSGAALSSTFDLAPHP